MKNYRINPNGHRLSGPLGPRPGFTLIEILIIIGIIAILVTIGVPAASRAHKLAAARGSRVTIGLISAACQAYHNDFGDYPPSDLNYGRRGGRLLCLLLSGYGPDPDPKGEPGVDGDGNLDLVGDDGNEGFGFRLLRRGRVYRYDVEKLPIAGNPRAFFADEFENPIFYYRYYGDPVLGYEWSENDGPKAADDYAEKSPGKLYRYDFILCTPGADGQWNKPSESGSDDITNFLKQ